MRTLRLCSIPALLFLTLAAVLAQDRPFLKYSRIPTTDSLQQEHARLMGRQCSLIERLMPTRTPKQVQIDSLFSLILETGSVCQDNFYELFERWAILASNNSRITLFFFKLSDLPDLTNVEFSEMKGDYILEVAARYPQAIARLRKSINSRFKRNLVNSIENYIEYSISYWKSLSPEDKVKPARTDQSFILLNSVSPLSQIPEEQRVAYLDSVASLYERNLRKVLNTLGQ